MGLADAEAGGICGTGGGSIGGADGGGQSAYSEEDNDGDGIRGGHAERDSEGLFGGFALLDTVFTRVFPKGPLRLALV